VSQGGNSCYKYKDGAFVAPVEGYLCGPAMDKGTRISGLDSGACAKYTNSRIVEFLDADQCKGLGPKDSFFVHSNNICSLYKEGQVSGARDFDAVVNCRIATGAIEYRWDDSFKTCYSYKDGLRQDLVANSFCGKSAVQIEVKSFGCKRYIDGHYDALLDRGVDECPPAEGIDDLPVFPTEPSAPRYSWHEAEQFCMKSGGDIVANYHRGKPKRTLSIKESVCYASEDGQFLESLQRGEKDCPPVSGSIDPTPVPSPAYSWDEEQQACLNTTEGTKVSNSVCGKPRRTLQVREGFCYVYSDGEFLKVLLRGEDDCPDTGNGNAGPIIQPTPEPRP
jgi:hypothetical protein